MSNGFGSLSTAQALCQEQMVVRAGGSDTFSIGVPWAADFNFGGNVYNVKTDSRLTSHAVGDGVTNDQPALQSAIDTAAAAGGGVVYLPAGTYKLSTSFGSPMLNLNNISKVVIQGAGQGVTTLSYGYGTPGSNFWVVFFQQVTKCGLCDLSIVNQNQGGAWSGTDQGALGSGGTSSELFIARVTGNFLDAHRLQLIGNDRIVVEDCTFTTLLTQLFMLGSTNYIVRNNTLTQQNGVHLDITESNRGVVEGNHFILDANGGAIAPPNVRHGIPIGLAQNDALINNTFTTINGTPSYDNDGESILSEGGAGNRVGEEMGTVLSSTSTTTTLSKSVNFISSTVIAIINGTGRGQWRTITARSSNVVTVDSPWAVTPDSTSFYSVFIWSNRNTTIDGNTFTGWLRGVWFYQGATVDTEVSNNHFNGQDGIFFEPAQNEPRNIGQFDPVWNTLVDHNTLSSSTATGTEINITCDLQATTSLRGIMALNNEIRNNAITGTGATYFENDPAWSEGYTNYLRVEPSPYNDQSIPATLGTIYQGNSGTTCGQQMFLINGGAYQTIIADSTSTSNAAFLTDSTWYWNTQGTHASVGTVILGSAGPPPPAPTLTATVGNAEVNLSWNTTAGASTYNVYRGTTAGGESTTPIVTGLTYPTYTDTGRSNGTAYYYKVAAVNIVGTSNKSNEATSTPNANTVTDYLDNWNILNSWSTNWTLDQNTNVPAFNGDTSRMMRTNDSQEYLIYKFTGITTFTARVYIYQGNVNLTKYYTSVDNGATFQPLTVSFGTGIPGGWTFYNVVPAGALPAGTNAIKIEFNTGTGNYWDPELGQISITYNGSATIPSAPTGLAATAGNAQVSLSWNASGGATSYNIYRSTTSGGEGTTPIATGVTTTSYVNTGLTNGTTYFYKVAAVNTAGTSAQSSEASATPQIAAPAAPTGLGATAGNAQVSLSWTAGSGATSYNVYRGTTAGGESTTAVATGITGTTYVNTGLTNGTTYFYKVKAVNSGGTSGYSNEASATPITIPSAPTGLSAIGGNAQVSLSWTASSGATSYNVYRGTTAGGESGTAIVTGITGTTYTNTGLTNGTQYFYKVAAVNGAGTSAQSNEASATPQVSIPSAPTGLTATPGNAQVVLNWTASSGATSYNVYRSTTSGGEGTTAIATSITGTTYTNTGLTNGTQYYYKVAAVNAAGTSAQSSEASATPNAVPAAPTGLSATGGNAQVVLNWTASSGATSYNVYRSTTSGGEGTTAIATGITGTTYTNTGLTNGTTYFYKVAAVNGAGTSAQSTEASATPNTVPSAPTGLTASPGNAQVSLSWTASSGATSYNVYRSTTSGGEGTTAIATGITGTTYNDTGLTNGTTYYYKVAAVNSAGTSPQSSEASATPSSNGAPGTPGGVVAIGNNGQVTIAWNPSGGSTSYNIYRSTTSGGEGSTPYAQGLTSTSWVDNGVSNGTTYYYKVAAVNANGTSAQSTEASASPNASIPYAPGGLNTSPGNGQVILFWSAQSGTTSYNLYRSTTAGGEGGTPLASGITALGYLDNTAVNGTTYYYKLAAVNASGTSAQSGEVNSTPNSALTTAPVLTATATGGHVNLTWTTVSGATSYNLFRSTTPGGEGFSPQATGLTGTSWTDNGVATGTTYYYMLAGVNGSGAGSRSAEKSATP